jgi:hypothetical protein
MIEIIAIWFAMFLVWYFAKDFTGSQGYQIVDNGSSIPLERYGNK